MTALTPVLDSTASPRPTFAPVTLRSIFPVELRKMFDTRSGFWMLSSIAILSALATGAVLLWAPNDEIKYSSFATAIGFPMSVILPMIAVLSVTSEWSQRSGLTTFTLVPHRGRVIGAKLLCVLAVGVVSMTVAMAIGALGNLLGAAITGVDTRWDADLGDLVYIVGGNVLGMLMGFVLGLLIRNSAGAIVGYFVYSLVLPTIFAILAASQDWFERLQPWVDFQYNQTSLFNGGFGASDWAHLAVTGGLWLLLPMAIGLWLVSRSEVK